MIDACSSCCFCTKFCRRTVCTPADHISAKQPSRKVRVRLNLSLFVMRTVMNIVLCYVHTTQIQLMFMCCVYLCMDGALKESDLNSLTGTIVCVILEFSWEKKTLPDMQCCYLLLWLELTTCRCYC